MAQRVPPTAITYVIKGAILTGCGVLLQSSGPVVWASGEPNLFSIGAAGAATILGTQLAADATWYIGKSFEAVDRKRPRYLKGSAAWIKSLREVRHELIKTGWGPFWGSFKKGSGELIADVQAIASIIGSTGVGKDVRSVGPQILAIRESKTVICLKPDTPCIYAEALRKRGEIVRIFDLGEVTKDLLGPSDHYNFLHLICDSFWRVGGIQDVTADGDEYAHLITPTGKESSGGDHKFFDGNEREIENFVIILVVIVKGYHATFGDVLQMLNDREDLLWHALWASGRLKQEDGTRTLLPLHESPWAHKQRPEDIDRFAEYLRALASKVVDFLTAQDTRNIDSFLAGATQALSHFNITTRAHKITQTSTFRFSEQKDEGKVVTIFLVADASRMEAQRPLLEMAQFCMMKEWIRHPNKQKPVYFIANEAGNFKIFRLASFLTWCRAYGVRIFLYLQSFAAFRITYGEETLKTLLSESEILQFLPGQSDPETLSIIEGMLGQGPTQPRSYSGQGGGPFGLTGQSIHEDARPLMTADEIRRCKKTIFFLRNNKPMLIENPSIAAIHPFRDQQGINPFYGKPYRLEDGAEA